MLGKIKKKFTEFVDNRIKEYSKQSKGTATKDEELTEADMSMAEAEAQKRHNSLIDNLKYSFQRDLSDLEYTNKEGKTVAMDSIDTCIKENKMSGMSGSPKDIVFTFFTKFGYIGWQICSVLAQHWLISNACSISNKDCLRNGWNNIFVDKKDKDESEEEKDKNQEILNKLYDIEQQEFSLNDKLLKWAYYRNVFGTAFLLPKIDGIDYEKPYNADGIKKGSFKGLAVIEPYWMIPEFDLQKMTDPTDINYFEPEFYRTSNGIKIHRSHLIIGRRKFVSDILKPSYYYGGISLAQEIYERVYASERCANEAPLLLLTKRLNYYKVKIKELFTNPQKYKKLADLLTEMRDNQGILFADHEDDFGQIDTSLSDLDQVIMEQYKLVSAIARIPVDKLFETNPTGGLSASGDYNIKNYNQDLNTLQNDVFKPAIDRINEIVMKSYFDKKDKVGIVFNPTDNPTEREIADLNKQKADTISIYLQNGIITPEEARQKIVEDKMSGFAFLKGVEMEEPTPEEQQEIEQMMNGNEQEQQEGKDEDDVDWVTVKGNHIPIKEGETKKEAVAEFIESKEVAKEGQKGYTMGEKQASSNSTQQSLPTVTKQVIEFASGRDDKSITKDKVLDQIQDFSYVSKDGKKYSYNKQQIQKMVNDVEAKIEEGKYNTTAKQYATKNEKGRLVWNEGRKAKHKEILKNIFKNAKPTDKPELVVLGGRGGSGKGGYTNKEGYLVLDNDKIKAMLPEYKGWNSSQVHEEASDIFKEALNIARNNKISVVLDMTLAGEFSKIENRVKPFIDNGYSLQAHYIHLPRQKSVQNSINRWLKGNADTNGKGRYVPIDRILEMTNNEDNFAKLVDTFKPAKYSFSTNDVKEGEQTKYLYGNLKDGGKDLWTRRNK